MRPLRTLLGTTVAHGFAVPPRASGAWSGEVVSNGLQSVFASVTASPLFSPRGEAKCVRGPSVRGARRLTSGGVLDSTVSTASKHNEVMAGLSGASAARWQEMRASPLPERPEILARTTKTHDSGRKRVKPARSLTLGAETVWSQTTENKNTRGRHQYEMPKSGRF